MSSPTADPIRHNADWREEFQPAGLVLASATLAVAATYAYFLVFAQFGFLKAVTAAVGEGDGLLRAILAVMGCGGIAGSALMAWRYQEKQSQPLLMGSLLVCAAAAGLTLKVRAPAGLFVVALLTGLGTGGLTVALAATLRRAVGGAWLGTCLGVGTGLAYAFSNVPAVFEAGPTGQALMAIVAACAGVVAVQGLDLRAPPQIPAGVDYQPIGVTAWVLIFLVLVGVDSAAFYVIQHTPALKAEAWSGSGRLYANALVHLLAGVLAGYALNQRAVGRTVLAATVMLLTSCLLIDRDYAAFGKTALLYPAAVSIYSTALVFYPARHGRPALAALVYSVAGWGGTALGIGLARDLNTVPRGFIIAAGLVVAGALGVRQWARQRAKAALNR
ncbi:MAG: hypothetical protein HYV95_14355 [Opitutae bacterium]|nr:hypothetical protein [Opitutae bacterium]